MTDKKCKNIFDKKLEIHDKKLNLLIHSDNKKCQQKWIKNLTTTTLPECMVDVASLGSNFNTLKRLSKTDTIMTIKNVEQKLEYIDINISKKNEIRKLITRTLESNLKKDIHLSIEEKELCKK